MRFRVKRLAGWSQRLVYNPSPADSLRRPSHPVLVAVLPHLAGDTPFRFLRLPDSAPRPYPEKLLGSSGPSPPYIPTWFARSSRRGGKPTSATQPPEMLRYEVSHVRHLPSGSQ